VDTCPKTGFAKVLPENLRAMSDYRMMQLTKMLPTATAFGHESYRTLVLLAEIDSELTRLTAPKVKHDR
jgi:hypothetical protein